MFLKEFEPVEMKLERIKSDFKFNFDKKMEKNRVDSSKNKLGGSRVQKLGFFNFGMVLKKIRIDCII